MTSSKRPPKIWLFLIIWLLAACNAQPGPALTQLPPAMDPLPVTAPAVGTEAIEPSPTMSPPTATPPPTPIPEVWSELWLVTSQVPLAVPNPTGDYQRTPVKMSEVALDTDTRWAVDLEVSQLQTDVGEASSGLILQGLNRDGKRPVLFWVYQSGGWNLGYTPQSEDEGYPFSEWFGELDQPAQHFDLVISDSGRKLTITNNQDFHFIHTFDQPLFEDSEWVRTAIQTGPQTGVTVTDLAIYQRQPAPVAQLPSQAPTPDSSGAAYVFHVAPDGDDSYPGTVDQPFATLEHARAVIRLILPGLDRPVEVLVHGGTYFLASPIRFDPQDSGQNGFEVVYRAAENETPVLSGGAVVTGWQPEPSGGVWKAVLPAETKPFRQFYVAGRRAQRAATETTLTGLGFVPGEFSDRDGIRLAASALSALARPQDLEVHWIYDWKDMRLRAAGLEPSATNPGEQVLWLLQPYYSFALGMEFEGHPWIPSYNVPFWLENAREFLDQPGEWYYNPDTHELFYWPLEGEDLATLTTVIPQTEALIQIRGGVLGQEVQNLAFEGLTFAYAGWTRASEVGTFGYQAQSLIMNPFYIDQEMTPAHVSVESGHHLRIEGCRFLHLGASGLNLGNNTANITVQGNLFYDISDAAIVVGSWEDAYITAPGIQAAPQDLLIANNRIDRVGVEYWGASGINLYYVANVQVLHNELSNLPYTGISLGWGWSNNPDSTTAHDNRIAGNLITDLVQRARDAGGIYTLGQQPGTVIEGNVIRRMGGDYACLYPDEGSAYITFQDNVCDTAPFWAHLWINTIHDIALLRTYTNVSAMENRGVDIRIEDVVKVSGQDWPAEAETILQAAGLEPAYDYLQAWWSDLVDQ